MIFAAENISSGVNYDELQDKQNVCDFHKLIEYGGPYVDKTLFINQIKNTREAIILIHRPPKWGKSINLSMLYYYFGINRVEGMIQSAKSYFNANTQKKFKIFEDQFQESAQTFLKQFHHPIILLNLKEAQFQSAQQFIGFLEIELQRYTQKPLNYLMKEKKSEKNCVSTLIYVAITMLNQVTKELQKQYNKLGCLLLIDNYCSPVEFMMFNNCPAEEIKKYREIMQALCKVFIKDNYITIKKRKVILTGKLDIWDQDICYADIKKCSLKKSYYSDSFGFDDKQIQEYLLPDINLDKKEIMQTLKKWHNGYLDIKNQNQIKKKYHPYTCKLYIQSCKTQKKIVSGKLLLSYKIYQKLFEYISSRYVKDLNQIISLLKKIQKLNNQQQKFSMVYYNYNRKQRRIVQYAIYNAIKKCQTQNYIQRQINQQAVLAYLLFYNGIITGHYNDICQIFNAYIPNQTFVVLLQHFLKLNLQDKQTMKDFSHIDIEKLEDVKLKFKTAINDWDCIGSLSQFRLNAMTLIRYGLSDQPTHRVYVEQKVYDYDQSDEEEFIKKGKQILDDCYFPYSTVNRTSFIVHSYELIKSIIKPSPEELNNLSQLIFWQIYCNHYFKWGENNFGISNQFKHINLIILRAFIFYRVEKCQFNQKKQYIWQIHTREISFNDEYFNRLQYFFNNAIINAKVRKIKGDFKKIAKQMLKFTHKSNVYQFTKFVTSKTKQQMQEFVKEREIIIKGQYCQILYQDFPQIDVEDGMIKFYKKGLNSQQIYSAVNLVSNYFHKKKQQNQAKKKLMTRNCRKNILTTKQNKDDDQKQPDSQNQQ